MDGRRGERSPRRRDVRQTQVTGQTSDRIAVRCASAVFVFVVLTHLLVSSRTIHSAAAASSRSSWASVCGVDRD